MTSRFLGLDHVGIAVADLDAAVRTYRDVLGFDVQGGEALPERGLDLRFAELGASRIELLGATRPDSEISGFLRKRGEGIHHLCVRVHDLDALLTELRERGATLIDPVPRSGAHGRRVAFVHPKGAHGVLWELSEEPPSASRR